MIDFLKKLFGRSRGLPRQSAATTGNEALTKNDKTQNLPPAVPPPKHESPPLASLIRPICPMRSSGEGRIILAATTKDILTSTFFPRRTPAKAGATAGDEAPLLKHESPPPASPICPIAPATSADSTAASTLQPFNASTSSDYEHALTGKIARFPKDIRDQLNRRIENGDPASEILPWLNNLSVAKTILDRHYDGVPVSEKNLSVWRQGGYQRWCQKKEPIALLKELKEDATDISRTGQSSLAGAAATVISARILQILQTISGQNLSPDDLAKAAFAITSVLKAEQNNIRLQHEKTRLCQRDHEILLKRDKHQRDVIATALRILGDARAKQIETSSAPYTEKVELLGQHMFPKEWQPRPVPENGASQPSKNSNLLTPTYPNLP